jgi:class 3 adenylate cyclase
VPAQEAELRALECAAAIQRAIAERNESAEEPMRVRIGLHTGEAIKEGADFFGKHVNLAARVAAQAEGGEILVSALFKELTESAGDIAFGEARSVELKGLKGKHRLYGVAWR